MFYTAKNNWIPGADDFTVGDRVINADDQTQILGEVQASYYFNIVACQFFHIWVVRNRFQSTFTTNPFRNPFLNFGVILEVRWMQFGRWTLD